VYCASCVAPLSLPPSSVPRALSLRARPPAITLQPALDLSAPTGARTHTHLNSRALARQVDMIGSLLQLVGVRTGSDKLAASAASLRSRAVLSKVLLLSVLLLSYFCLCALSLAHAWCLHVCTRLVCVHLVSARVSALVSSECMCASVRVRVVCCRCRGRAAQMWRHLSVLPLPCSERVCARGRCTRHARKRAMHSAEASRMPRRTPSRTRSRTRHCKRAIHLHRLFNISL